jgi:nitrite reductase (NADH) small subunit
MENRCPHRGGPLADGIVSVTAGSITVTCPLHNWRVEVEGGRVVKPSGQEAACVRTFPAKVENGIITVSMVSETAGKEAQESAAA